MPCFKSSVLENEVNFQQTARSMHVGGVFTMRLDGSAHFVGDNIFQKSGVNYTNQQYKEEIGTEGL
ncbi:MAG: hypothetical protein R3C11_19045 [Planctomycetaceae bacterium]